MLPANLTSKPSFFKTSYIIDAADVLPFVPVIATKVPLGKSIPRAISKREISFKILVSFLIKFFNFFFFFKSIPGEGKKEYKSDQGQSSISFKMKFFLYIFFLFQDYHPKYKR